MFYTEATETTVIDSIFNQDSYRTEFRLDKPDTLYMSNLRIENLGVMATSVSVAGNGCRVNFLTGEKGIIRNIFLMDGSKMLDNIVNFGDFGAFQEYNHSNQQNSDVYKHLNRSGQGYLYHKDQTNPGDVANAAKIKEASFGNFVGGYQDSTPLGTIHLNQVFPLLKSMTFLHTGLFPNLRVVLEYYPKTNKDILVKFQDNPNNGYGVAATSLPILVADAITNEKVANEYLANFKQVVYTGVECDTVNLPLSSTYQKFRLNGFANKTLSWMLLQKKQLVNDTASTLFARYGSQFCFGERVQVVVNGQNLLSENGLERPSQTLDLLTQTFGRCNAFTGSSTGALFGIGNVLEYAPDRCGKLAYVGCQINQPVKTLDLEYQRENVVLQGYNVVQYNQGLQMNVWAGVQKAIVKTKGGYQVMYL